ncbi:M20 family metallopeptidase [Neorhizobium sp. IRS_2294]|uniref:M20 family metallopeptidase n=1 Tax=unclassified Neorhizobium TaxID=2629175 RepID=UPI003D2851B3
MTGAVSALAQKALDLTQAWCRIPSVRGNDAAMAEQEQAIVDWLIAELGADIVSAQSSKGRPPVIHARLNMGSRETVILYNMYDVMPATADGWSVDPFEGGIVDLDGIGPSFVARGAENNKGPLAGMLCVLKELVDSGRLLVNVEILIEGEEESGSGALRDYLLDPDCPVRPSRAAIFPSFCEYGGGPPRIYLGFSGIAKGEIRVDAGAWGGPKSPIHSSNAPWIANPASRLVEALSHFGQAPNGRLGQIDLDAEAQEIIATLAEHFDAAAELLFRNTDRFSLEADAGGLLSHVLSAASLNLSSLTTEPQKSDAIIPPAASAGFDLRCPPSLVPADYIDGFRSKLDVKAIDGVTISVADSYPGHRFARGAAGVDALLDAYSATSRKPQIWPWAIGAAPAYAFARHAESFLLAGAGRGGNAHGIDEFLTLESFERFLVSLAVWLTAMGSSDPFDGGG